MVNHYAIRAQTSPPEQQVYQGLTCVIYEIDKMNASEIFNFIFNKTTECINREFDKHYSKNNLTIDIFLLKSEP